MTPLRLTTAYLVGVVVFGVLMTWHREDFRDACGRDMPASIIAASAAAWPIFSVWAVVVGMSDWGTGIERKCAQEGER